MLKQEARKEKIERYVSCNSNLIRITQQPTTLLLKRVQLWNSPTSFLDSIRLNMYESDEALLENTEEKKKKKKNVAPIQSRLIMHARSVRDIRLVPL